MTDGFKRTKITGLVGNRYVIAYEYPRKDFGLSYYEVDGKKYFGTAVFTEEFERKQVKY